MSSRSSRFPIEQVSFACGGPKGVDSAERLRVLACDDDHDYDNGDDDDNEDDSFPCRDTRCSRGGSLDSLLVLAMTRKSKARAKCSEGKGKRRKKR